MFFTDSLLYPHMNVWGMIMPKTLFATVIAACAMTGLSGCMVAKSTGQVAALPVKAVYKTGEFAGKSVYHTGKFAGQGVYKTGELAGKSVYYTGKAVGNTAVGMGKGIYYMGTVPVKITDKALDTTSKVLTVTTQAADATGKVVSTSRQIQSAKLDAELGALQGMSNLLSVVVDVAN